MSKKAKKRASGAATTTAVREVSAPSGSADFNPDYTYIKKDLRRIASLAIFFFVVLIVLTIVLR